MNVMSKIDDFNQKISHEELFFHLNQIIVSFSDEELGREKSKTDTKKKTINEMKNTLSSVKAELNKSIHDCEKLQLLKTILTRIDALKREGVLVGKNKAKILEILTTINEKSLKYLKLLENKLVSYVPETSSRKMNEFGASPNKVIY